MKKLIRNYVKAQIGFYDSIIKKVKNITHLFVDKSFLRVLKIRNSIEKIAKLKIDYQLIK